MTWQEEARDIKPWPYVRLRWCGPFNLSPGVVIFGVADLHADDLARCVVDLSDPDVLAAFDRRLALRLGVPADVTSVVVRLVGEVLRVSAVFVADVRTPGALFPAWSRDMRVDTHDPTLARVRAWNSVKL